MSEENKFVFGDYRVRLSKFFFAIWDKHGHLVDFGYNHKGVSETVARIYLDDYLAGED